jgi:hypothetical protein
MKKTKSGRKKRSVTCKRITGPHLRHMIAQEGFPSLSTRSFSGSWFQIPLDSSFDFREYTAEGVLHGCAPLPRVGYLLPSPGSM